MKGQLQASTNGSKCINKQAIKTSLHGVFIKKTIPFLQKNIIIFMVKNNQHHQTKSYCMVLHQYFIPQAKNHHKNLDATKTAVVHRTKMPRTGSTRSWSRWSRRPSNTTTRPGRWTQSFECVFFGVGRCELWTCRTLLLFCWMLFCCVCSGLVFWTWWLDSKDWRKL